MKKKPAPVPPPILAIGEVVSLIVELEMIRNELTKQITTIGVYVRHQMGLGPVEFGDLVEKTFRIANKPARKPARKKAIRRKK